LCRLAERFARNWLLASLDRPPNRVSLNKSAGFGSANAQGNWAFALQYKVA
jgi:hypothetical protein